MIQYRGHKPFLALGRHGQFVPVYWSNNFVPFDEFIFMSKGFGEWLVKPDPDTHHSLTIEIEPSKTSKNIEVRVRTVAYLLVRNPNAGLLLNVRLPRKEK